MQMPKNELKSAYIFLQCDKKSHNDCRKIRDVLLEKHPNVRRAQTTNAKIRGEQWCVAATALVNTANEDKFKKELYDLHTDSKRPVGISNVHLIVDQQ